MWDLPRSGVEPVSPTLAGGFFIIAPPGKPLPLLFIDHISILTSKTFFILRRFLSRYLFKFVVCLNLHILWKPTCPGSSTGTESACSAGDPGSIPGSGRSPVEGKDYPLQYSDLENSMECIVHGVAKSWTQMSNLHFHFQECKKWDGIGCNL